ncbi:hypothetical protein [Viridibacillus arvi]|uniref:hypothetical protein n=1 Tax=Viridibacillus arvi TaxID=263475 RepID=UPI003D2BBFB2
MNLTCLRTELIEEIGHLSFLVIIHVVPPIKYESIIINKITQQSRTILTTEEYCTAIDSIHELIEKNDDYKGISLK